MNKSNVIPLPEVFRFTPPAWANTRAPKDDPEAQLRRASELANCFYPLAVQTGIHAIIEWCGIMGEHAKILEHAYAEHQVVPSDVDQHTGEVVPLPPYMVEYFCEKLGCQLKPLIRGNKKLWRAHIERWFSGDE